MWSREVRILARKELQQFLRTWAGIASAFLLPALLLFVMPLVQIVATRRMGLQALVTIAVPAVDQLPLGLRELVTGDAHTFLRGILPLLVALGGLVVPAVMSAYLLIAEREQRTLELLAALPVRIGHILSAKLVVAALLSGGVTVAMFLLNAVLLVAFGFASVGYVTSLVVLLLSALLFSTASSVLTVLLAKDFRTANNITGALLGPTLAFTLVVTAYVPGQTTRLLATALLYLVGASLCAWSSVRYVSFERLLR